MLFLHQSFSKSPYCGETSTSHTAIFQICLFFVASHHKKDVIGYPGCMLQAKGTRQTPFSPQIFIAHYYTNGKKIVILQ
jgi:hypothetical protein